MGSFAYPQIPRIRRGRNGPGRLSSINFTWVAKTTLSGVVTTPFVCCEEIRVAGLSQLLWQGGILVLLLICLNYEIAAQDPVTQWTKIQQKKELTKAMDLLEGWVNQGAAAGLGDLYWDNRDDGHSAVNLQRFPEMKKVEYAPSEAKTLGWGLQQRVLPHTTVGNSSTAHSDIKRGSQTRFAYTNRRLHDVLYRQYRGNNLYIYPEHRDHDLGNRRRTGKKYDDPKNKRSGYGDLFPTNTPYLITSQGSSGSDKPFIATVARTIGAFRPEVRARLEQLGLLMPTVQMLLRSTQRQVKGWDDYFSGRAHPAVFDGKQLNPVAMVRAAHAMTLATIPPLVQLEIVEEDRMVPDRDYFARPGFTEKISDTPAVIARVWRGYPMTRRMVVSAKGSIDPNQRPLKFKWVVLRGDPTRVKITPLGPQGSEAEIVIEYTPRRAASWNEDLWSNRIDLGVFARNGDAVSAPAFITWYTLDNEERSYDAAGRIREIEYGTGRFVDPRLGATNTWRDTYHWKGSDLQGWTRTDREGRVREFSADGQVVSIPDRLPGGETNPKETQNQIPKSPPDQSESAK